VSTDTQQWQERLNHPPRAEQVRFKAFVDAVQVRRYAERVAVIHNRRIV
jgi:hypothetical protein